MGLQEAFNRVEQSVPFGFIKPKRKRLVSDKARHKMGRGFASMSKEARKAASVKGAKKAHANPKHLRCYEFTPEAARKAALKRWGKL